jgi:hypothetical protein
MEKYLVFKTAANDSVCLPARLLSHMHIDSDGESLDMNFVSIDGNDGAGEYNIPLGITDNKGREVMEAIAKEIRTGGEPLVVVVDDIAKEFIHANLLSCGTLPAVS